MGKLSRKGIITDVVLQKDNRPPILVNFENGDLDPNHSEGINFNIHRSRSTKQRMVTTTVGNIFYRGVCQSNQLRSFLAIRNKTTNEVKLVEAAVCMLSPLFEKKESSKLDISDKEIKGELAKAYGTKSRRLRAILDETLKLDSEEVQLAASKMEIKKEDMTPIVDSVFNVLPPHNREAKVIEEVYKLEDILIPDIQHCFDSEVQRIMNTSLEELKAEKFSDFFYASWSVLQHRQDVDMKILNLKSLLFIESLGTLLQANRVALKKPGFSPCYFSETLNDHILDMFTSKSVTGRLMSNAQKDKAFSYILVLCLLIFNYKIDLTTLIKVSHSSMTRLTQLSRVIGAMVSKEHVANLRLPLSAPPISRGNRKKPQ